MTPIALSLAEAAAAAGGTVASGDPQVRIERWGIDSRAVAPGEMFVAIRGEQFDGHAFVAAALAAGAAGAVVTAASAVPEAGPGRPAPHVIVVPDTTVALQAIAREIRRRSGARVVAITGSAGKTTTKELAAAFLAARFSVFRNKGNLNNHIGVPLSLLELRHRPDVAVVELGMNHAGEIRTLIGVAEPEVRVWTNVGDAHMGFFASAEAIADAKGEILEAASPSDVLVANADDPRIAARLGRFPGRIVPFGLSAAAEVRASAVEMHGLDGTTATITTPRGEVRVTTPLVGTGNLLNFLAAAAVATTLDVPLDAVAERAAQVKPAPRRGEVLRLPGGITLIDDSYNSSPSALRQALATVAATNGSARRVAILGEMLELGAHADRLHRECGAAAAASGLELLIAVGGAAARTLADAAVAGGMAPAAVAYAGSSDEAAGIALKKIRPGDLVLVKGSRGIRTDVVVEQLKAEFA